MIAHTVNIWAGYSGALAGSEQVSNSACVAARDADYADRLIVPGWRPGATFYFDGTSRMKSESNGNIEMFARQQGQHMVSVQALPGSTSNSSTPLIRTDDFGVAPTSVVIHGLVWAPDGWFTFDNDNAGSLQKLLGGIVVGGLWTPKLDPSKFEIEPATSTVDTRILLTSTRP